VTLTGWIITAAVLGIWLGIGVGVALLIIHESREERT
jgi:predicted RND superfamily exporter protein